MFQEISLKAPGEKKLWSDLLQSNYYEIVGQIDESIKYPMGFKVFFTLQKQSSEVFCKKGINKKSISESCNFIKKETLAQVFSCEFCEIFKNTFYYRTPLIVASVSGSVG